jgi:beta-glucosidase
MNSMRLTSRLFTSIVALGLCAMAAVSFGSAGRFDAPQSQPASPAATQPQSQPGPKRSTVAPLPRTADHWMLRTGSYNKLARRGNLDLLFLGDSITQSWETTGKDVWDQYYGQRKAANFGIGGDRTEHDMWRITNGNLDFPADHPPKLVVQMIGTNNSGDIDITGKDIADGIIAIVNTLRDKLPNSKVLLLAIFPRSQSPDAQRAKNAEASEIASRIADGTDVIFLDIGTVFLNDDASILPGIMPDYLHLSEEGYERWAKAIEPTVEKILGD